jgi:hypothetical protein
MKIATAIVSTPPNVRRPDDRPGSADLALETEGRAAPVPLSEPGYVRDLNPSVMLVDTRPIF